MLKNIIVFGASDTEFMYCYNYGLNSSYNCQSSNLISPQPLEL